MVHLEQLRALMDAAQIKIPVAAGDHPSNEEQIEDAHGDVLVYKDGDLTGEQARYIAALLNVAPELIRAATVRLNLEYDVLNAVYAACRRIEGSFPGGAGPVAARISAELQRVAREEALRNPKPAQGEAELTDAEIWEIWHANMRRAHLINGTNVGFARMVLAAAEAKRNAK